MDKKEKTKSKVSSRLEPAKWDHLKPLSAYSRMVSFDKDSLHQFCNPFVNFKIEIVNNCVKKRKLDDSSPDEGYETPATKAFSPKALSPDLGCFMDDCGPSARHDSVSHFAISKPELSNKTQTIRNEVKQTVNFQLHSHHVECGSSTEPEDHKRTVPPSLKREKVLFNVAPAFDCDVNDILSLSPFGTYTAGGFSGNVESWKRPSSNTFQNKPALIPTVAHGQVLERGDGQEEEERELKKEVCVHVKDVEEDKGYFSMYYMKDLKTGKEPSQSPQLPPATSGLWLRVGGVEALEDECHPGSSSVPECPEEAVLSGQHVSFPSGPLLEPVDSPVELLEDEVEEEWNIGLPMFESSVCHNVDVKLNAGSEQSGHLSEEAQGGLMASVSECRATLNGEEATLDTSYETTLPLQVQVKSVIVVPSQQTSSSKPVSPPLPKQNSKSTKPRAKENRVSQAAKGVCSARSQRLLSEVDLERGKQLYLRSVARHMNENPGADQGVMSELQSLMTHVADQTAGTHGRQWQHPSDLTRRNYQRRFGNTVPTMSLQEWQAKSDAAYERFARVPNIFQRSQSP